MAKQKTAANHKVVKKTVTLWGVDNLNEVVKNLPNLVPGLQVKSWKKVGRGAAKKSKKNETTSVNSSQESSTNPVLTSEV